MNRSGRNLFRLGIAGALLLCGAANAQFTTNLADFGFKVLSVDGEPATDTRPLLIILTTNRVGQGGVFVPPDHNEPFFTNLFFNLGATQSVMGYFRENSNNRFRWTEADIVGPVSLTTNELQSVLGNDNYYSNIIARVIMEGKFNFKPFDFNSNGVVTGDELQMVFIMNEADSFGGARVTGYVSTTNVPGANVDVSATCCSELLYINYQAAFDTICHELSHTLGLQGDIYNQGCLNNRVTVMSCSSGPDDRDTYHLDPWNKMRLGWSEPRIMLLNTGGVVTLPAANRQITNAPVILYDTNNGPSKFFIIEYRKQTNYDRNVVADGLVIWHVMHNNFDFLQIPSAGAGFYTEGGWSVCPKCACFIYSDTITNSCPADGMPHNDSSPYFIENVDSTTVPGEPEWRRCRNCAALYYGLNELVSVCPFGSTHLPPTVAIENRNYSVRTNGVRGALAGWYRCVKCQGIFNMGAEAASLFKAVQTCPAGANHNPTNGMGVLGREYFLVAWDASMFAMFPPNLTREPGNNLWVGGDITPLLSWADGTPTKSRLYVRPFAAGADEITVEVRSAEDTWVDFNYLGFPRNGSFNQPYNTLAEGVSNVTWGGILNFKPASSSETSLITKPLTLIATNGSAKIGQ